VAYSWTSLVAVKWQLIIWTVLCELIRHPRTKYYLLELTGVHPTLQFVLAAAKEIEINTLTQISRFVLKYLTKQMDMKTLTNCRHRLYLQPRKSSPIDRRVTSRNNALNAKPIFTKLATKFPFLYGSQSFICGPEKLSRYSYSLRAGWSGVRIPVEGRFSVPVMTGPRTHPASSTMGTESLFRRVKRSEFGVNHPPQFRADVKERVELYFYSPSGSSWPVIG
jgi:hypothetical protein